MFLLTCDRVFTSFLSLFTVALVFFKVLSSSAFLNINSSYLCFAFSIPNKRKSPKRCSLQPPSVKSDRKHLLPVEGVAAIKTSTWENVVALEIREKDLEIGEIICQKSRNHITKNLEKLTQQMKGNIMLDKYKKLGNTQK